MYESKRDSQVARPSCPFRMASSFKSAQQEAVSLAQRRRYFVLPSKPTRPFPDCPLVVAYGLGVDSTAMLIEFAHRQIRPDLILFADTPAAKSLRRTSTCR
jgi:hypothetical protein